MNFSLSTTRNGNERKKEKKVLSRLFQTALFGIQSACFLESESLLAIAFFYCFKPPMFLKKV